MIRLHRPACPNPEALADGNYKHPSNKSALKDASNDKCMYCECKISHIDFAHVEHIKPKANDKFPQLKFSWDNLGYACPRCNNAKSDKYHNDTPYINPYDEDPQEHLVAYGTYLFSKNGSERGELTIKDIKLNRPELLEKRQQRIEEIKRSIDACFRTASQALRDAALAELQKEAESDKELSLFVKSFLVLNEA
ncbi:HNH endonuclease signature motif containing protein [Vibrio vulnificus]|uniref:HNH endonuclease signature motif containing protein n=1 Tax=Vibrio vulnificus TaxID=672 RepID=UPI002879A28E|nr:HNH endonuclease signature motif containing protein [Vibrio vulnificus]EHZ2591095.1 HNH endonuclease [Vibrio parahaemolyticus]MDS1869839.1 HNH endonuclease signature motif containing protein [Vibrio vulnificus]